MGFSFFAIWPSQNPTPEEKAVVYLTVEVPRWLKENRCYSCHNNGDGARALYLARRLGLSVGNDALADTTRWISQPLEWDNNTGDPVVSDKKLARIQFMASLAEASNAGLASRDLLVQAADSLLPYQEKDGSWAVLVDAGIGTPATYGPVLATAIVRQSLATAGEERFSEAIRRADAWLANARRESIMDVAAIVMVLRDAEGVRFLLDSQTSDGGWGPYPKSPAEAFDTAIALLALQPLREQPRIAESIRRGRSFLISMQYADGGWPETTRPSGGTSYAQHISTTGWATLAMLRTR